MPAPLSLEQLKEVALDPDAPSGTQYRAKRRLQEFGAHMARIFFLMSVLAALTATTAVRP